METTYCVAKMDDDGHLERLTPFQSYDKCDEVIDRYHDRYPFAYVDIFTHLEWGL